MSIFAVFLPMKDEQKSEQYRPEHLEFLEKLHESGHVPAYGKFADGSGGLVMYKVNSYEEAETLVKEDPFVKEGARTYEIREWVMTSSEWK